MLTLNDLQEMKPDTIFAKGEMVDDEDGLFMSNSKKVLRWVAVRGGIDDWAVYCGFADKSYEEIKRRGDKVPRSLVKKLVPCIDEAYRRYRI